MTVLAIIIGAGCVVGLLRGARRQDLRNAAQLRGIELRADTTRRDEGRRALKAKGGAAW